MLVRFKSDSSYNYGGFKFLYEFANESSINTTSFSTTQSWPPYTNVDFTTSTITNYLNQSFTYNTVGFYQSCSITSNFVYPSPGSFQSKIILL